MKRGLRLWVMVLRLPACRAAKVLYPVPRAGLYGWWVHKRTGVCSYLFSVLGPRLATTCDLCIRLCIKCWDHRCLPSHVAQGPGVSECGWPGNSGANLGLSWWFSTSNRASKGHACTPKSFKETQESGDFSILDFKNYFLLSLKKHTVNRYMFLFFSLGISDHIKVKKSLYHW